MAIEIPLKTKYLVGGTNRYRSVGGTSGVRKTKPGGDKRRGSNHPAEPVAMMMVVSPTGKRRMHRA